MAFSATAAHCGLMNHCADISPEAQRIPYITQTHKPPKRLHFTINDRNVRLVWFVVHKLKRRPWLLSTGLSEGQGEVAAVDDHEHKASDSAQPLEPKRPGNERGGERSRQPRLASDTADGEGAHKCGHAQSRGGIVGGGAKHPAE